MEFIMSKIYIEIILLNNLILIFRSSTMILFDSGQIIFKGGQRNIENSLNEQNQSIYVPLKIQLKNLQLLYLKKR